MLFAKDVGVMRNLRPDIPYPWLRHITAHAHGSW